MTDLPLNAGTSQSTKPVNRKGSAAAALRQKRHRANSRFRAYGLAAVVLAILFLVAILADIFIKAMPAFTQSTLKLSVPMSTEFIDPSNLKSGDYDGAVRSALRGLFPDSTTKAERKAINSLVSSSAGTPLQKQIAADPSLAGKTVTTDVLLSSDADLYAKGVTVMTATWSGVGASNPSGQSGPVSLELSPGAISDILKSAGLGHSGSATLDSNTASLLISINGGIIRATSVKDDTIAGETLVPLSASTGGIWRAILLKAPEAQRKITDAQVAFLEILRDQKRISSRMNTAFFARGDSREPELAGILSGLVGTAYTMLITLGLCLPIGLAAAIYLEEFAPRNALTYLIEISINNLAAVPSIVFGLLGLAVFLNVFGLPRSSPLAGGLVLALLVMPTIIIASRAALKSVPPSIREAAIGIGATRQQAVFHHVLPVAMPGILTGTIIGMAHALGETAPLLMIGMVAFIADIPNSPADAATVLPVQIFLWSDLPEAGFQSKTAAAILVLLAFLVTMNSLAIWLRTKFERRW